MLLSVIIVNYNVRHFLEQCLCSVQKALAGEDGEIIVVDNDSSDKSLEYLKPRFPTVHFIASGSNLGFARACNLGLRGARGRYILFLNPDTIVPEDCFRKCIDFLVQHPDAGALGVRMLDGSGKFLKESKRSFPSPFTSLYKLIGLSRIFPRSKVFSRYHLGHLDEKANHAVDVLAGAFMMLKKEILDKVGGFDETFFMYGEDVDLSYRVQAAGYKNYYFAGTSIIHFKGESTRKGSMNYVRMFYKAMSIFVHKHYGGGRAGIFKVLIHIAIWTRAALTAMANFIRRIGLPLIDAGLIFLSFLLMKNIWSEYVRKDIVYENRLLWIAMPVYTVCYLLTAYYAGLYDRWYRKFGLIRSTLIATIVLLAGYSLLPERLRFSRAIILFGAMLAFVLISIQRWILIRMQVLTSREEKEEQDTTVIIGTEKEFESLMQLLRQAGLEQRILGRVAVSADDLSTLGNWNNLTALSRSAPFREVIYCEGTITFADIINSLEKLPRNIVAKIHAAESDSIVSSNSKDSSGETLTVDIGFNIAKPYNRRLKRLIDVILSLFGLIFFPLHFFLVKKPASFFGNCFRVLLARKTWVGYAAPVKNLPILKPGVITSNGMVASRPQSLPAQSLQKIDYWYARDYEPAADIRLIRKTYRHLGDA